MTSFVCCILFDGVEEGETSSPVECFLTNEMFRLSDETLLHDATFDDVFL